MANLIAGIKPDGSEGVAAMSDANQLLVDIDDQSPDLIATLNITNNLLRRLIRGLEIVYEEDFPDFDEDPEGE